MAKLLELEKTKSAVCIGERIPDKISSQEPQAPAVEQPSGFEMGEALPIKSRYEDLPPSIRAEISEAEFKQLEHLSIEEIVDLFK